MRDGNRLVHSDLNATACPGDRLQEWVKAGGLRENTQHVPAPVTPTPADPRYIRGRCRTWDR